MKDGIGQTDRRGMKKETLRLTPVGATVWLIRIAHFSVGILLLHHYKSDLAHLSDFDSLVIGMSKSER